MATTAKELLEGAMQTVKLMPGLSEAELAQFQKTLPRPMPESVREALLYAAGFDAKPIGSLRGKALQLRLAGHDSFEFDQAFPKAIDLLPDGSGNFWVIDIDRETGDWGPVFYARHDPAVIVVQAPDLPTFLSQLLRPAGSGTLESVVGEAVTRIWNDDPLLMSEADARASTDTTLSSFAKTLPSNFMIADLRSRTIGSGFSWGKAGPSAEVRRCPGALIFAVEQKKTRFLSRLFSRT